VGKANEARECALDGVPTIRNTSTTVILRSRALARRLEGWPLALVAHPSRLGMKNAEHLRMTAVCINGGHGADAPLPTLPAHGYDVR
jgi:hypothetical protein